jgi:hypothetical protein
MTTFLRVNGFDVTASYHELFGWMIALTMGLTPEQLAARMAPHIQPRAP